MAVTGTEEADAVKPEPRCVLDRARPCRGCIATSPVDCPYRYLLDDAPDALADGPLPPGDEVAA